MKKLVLKKVSVFLTLAFILTLFSCGGAPSQEGASSAPAESETVSVEPFSQESAEISEEGSQEVSEEISAPETPFVPVIRFAVASDVHISYSNSAEARRFEQLFKSAYGYAESDPDYDKLDAVIVVGDMTNKGLGYEYNAFLGVADRNLKEGTQFITVMGNHELYEGGAQVYLERADDRLDKHIVINGFHFIGISPNKETGFSEDSVAFLETELEKAASDGEPDRPIIVFQHHHIKDTVYVSSEWYADESTSLKRIMNKYPQVIDFSGHSHGPVNNPTSIWQGKFTCLGTGTLSYFEMTSGMSYGTIPPGASDAAQYYIVEISADYRVKIMPYNILTEDFFKTPSNTDDPDEQLVYYIDSKKDPALFRYTGRSKNADKPYFAEDEQISVAGVTEYGAVITFPQAFDGECIYSYGIKCVSETGTKRFNCFSEYYFEPLKKEISFTVTGLEEGTAYDVTVTPADCYGKKGEPISASFVTEKAKEVVYTSRNEVNFYGTFTNFDSAKRLARAQSTPAYGGGDGGDIFAGDWASGVPSTKAGFELANDKGYEGSPCLAVWSEDTENRGLYIFATESNKNSTEFPSIAYLRVWVDLGDVAFRKASFGLVSPEGALFTTDDEDYRTDQYFWYLAEGSDKWVRYAHGNDGCFGDEQGSDVKGFKGWLAFPVKDFVYRAGTGSAHESEGTSFHSRTVRGVYLFWDYSERGEYAGNRFYIDEISIVKDYTSFEPYSGE